MSVRAFAYSVAGVEPSVLRSIAANTKAHYQIRDRFDRGKRRRVMEPSPVLKAILKRINTSVLSKIELPACVHSRRNGSPYSNASVHVGQPWVVALDVKNFFPSIDAQRVYRVWREQVGFGDELSELLARLTTCNGAVPIGAPTSSSIGNLVLVSADRTISAACERDRDNYSRWVDDLSLSGEHCVRMIAFVMQVVRNNGFRISRAKIVVRGPGRQHIVTGFVVNGPRPTSRQDFLNRVRAEIARVEQQAGEEQTRLLRSIAGSLAYLQQSNPGFVRRQWERLPIKRLGTVLDRQETRRTSDS